jgi:hypothetical protein
MGAMELSLMGLGEPLGFTDYRETGNGALVAHKTIPSHKHTKFQEASTACLLTHRDPARDNQETSTKRAGSTLESSGGYQHVAETIEARSRDATEHRTQMDTRLLQYFNSEATCTSSSHHHPSDTDTSRHDSTRRQTRALAKPTSTLLHPR